MINEKNSHKKVLHIVSCWGTGGIERYIYNYSKYLTKYSFDVLTLQKSDQKSIFESDKINIYHIDEIKENYIKRTKERKKYILDFLKEHKYDIIHFDMSVANSFILAKTIKKKYANIKIVMHCHATSVNSPYKFLKLILHKFCKIFYIKYADYYIGASFEAMRWMYNKKIIKSNNSMVLNCGIEIDKFKFDESKRKNIREKFNISNNKFVIGTVGRFCNQKNIPFIVKIIEEYSKIDKDFIFLWVGEGNLFESTKKIIEKKELNSKVIFTGIQNNIEDIYSAMDVFILPSFFEGNPTVSIEAQANGLICLLSNKITKSNDLSGNIKFLSIDNIDEWINEIKKSKENCKHNLNMQFMIDKKISVKENVKTLEKIYDEMLQKNNKKDIK